MVRLEDRVGALHGGVVHSFTRQLNTCTGGVPVWSRERQTLELVFQRSRGVSSCGVAIVGGEITDDRGK